MRNNYGNFSQALIRSFLFALAVALQACGSSAPEEAFFKQSPRKPLPQNLEEASIQCEAPSECSESVGMILGNVTHQGQEGVARCTGFLIAADLVATNSHCIPESVKEDPSKCSTQLGIKFPEKEGSPAVWSLCEELLTFSEIAKEGEADFVNKSDFAFFRLAKAIPRGALAIDRSGLAQNQKFSFVAVDPSPGQIPSGTIRKNSCEAVKGSKFIPLDRDENSEVSVLFCENCKAKPGNSGSPVLNDQGLVVAILHGGLDPKMDLNAKASADAEKLERPAFVTNLRCAAIVMEKLESIPPAPPLCAADNREAYFAAKRKAFKDETNEAIRKAFVKAFSDWNSGWLSGPTSSSPTAIEAKHRLKFDEGFLEINYQLDISYNLDGSIATVLHKDLCILHQAPTSPQTVLQKLPIFALLEKRDRYSRVQYRAYQISTYRLEVTVSAEEMKEKLSFQDGLKLSNSNKAQICKQ